MFGDRRKKSQVTFLEVSEPIRTPFASGFQEVNVSMKTLFIPSIQRISAENALHLSPLFRFHLINPLWELEVCQRKKRKKKKKTWILLSWNWEKNNLRNSTNWLWDFEWALHQGVEQNEYKHHLQDGWTFVSRSLRTRQVNGQRQHRNTGISK